MRYTFFVALRGIMQNIWAYLVIFLELILCFSLIFIGLNKADSEQKRYKLINEVEEMGSLTNYQEIRQNLTQDQMNNFEMDVMKDSECLFSKISQINFSVGGDVQSVPLLIANQAFIQKYVSKGFQGADVFIGSDNDSKFNDAVSMENIISVQNGKWYLQDRELTVANVSKILKYTVPTDIDYLRDINLNKAIILNGSKLLSSNYQNLEVTNTFLMIRGKTNDVKIKLATLNELYFNGSSLKINSLVAKFEKGSQDIMEFISVFSWASQIAFLIVFVGVLGILLILLEKRKRKISLAIILGASKIRVLLEVFLEILILTACASMISSVIIYFLQPYISSVYYLIEYSYKSILSAICLPVLMSSIPVLFIFRTYFKVDLSELMKYDA